MAARRSWPLNLCCLAPQGKWLGFRSSAAGDRFLQARKRAAHRLALFNTNVGTWEQWEAVASSPADLGAAPWAAATLTLRHRRLPWYELAVEVVRVGTYSLLLPDASITPRSLVLPAAAGAAGAPPSPSENANLRKMSGVLMHVSPPIPRPPWNRAIALRGRSASPAACILRQHLCRISDSSPSSPSSSSVQEWFTFVDREKGLRAHLEAKVAQLVEDAAALKAWTLATVSTSPVAGWLSLSGVKMIASPRNIY